MNSENREIAPLKCAAAVGYINEHQQVALVHIESPGIVNAGVDFVQIAITVETAIDLRAALNAFLKVHGVVAH